MTNTAYELEKFRYYDETFKLYGDKFKHQDSIITRLHNDVTFLKEEIVSLRNQIKKQNEKIDAITKLSFATSTLNVNFDKLQKAPEPEKTYQFQQIMSGLMNGSINFARRETWTGSNIIGIDALGVIILYKNMTNGKLYHGIYQLNADDMKAKDWVIVQ